LLHIRQNSSVADYVERFAELIDQLTAYGHVTEPVYYAMRFVDGLRDEFRPAVLLHRPVDFDTAASLALLQEDIGGAIRSSRRSDCFSGAKSVPRNPLPLPPPPHIDKQDVPILLEEKKLCDGKSPEDRMAALRAFCRAKGLCVRCAEKWSREHKCAATVQLHAVQELFELFDMEEPVDSLEGGYQDQIFLALSKDAVSGTEGPRTMRLKGVIEGKEALILVDSGTSHTFLSKQFAIGFSGLQQLCQLVQLQVANGESLCCSAVLPQASWSVQEYSFVTDMKILELQHFDMILGMDWLEQFSPMTVHWKHKWMAIPYEQSTAFLQGILPVLPNEVVVHVCALVDASDIAHTDLPPEVALILKEFALTFAAPSQLPPERNCDHVIPLVPGAKPIHIRPYRYPPSLKDEIKKQVADMLAKGIIQPSSSAFSSPILLVRKKDGSWRFCVDYRYLNALTLKSKFPIPIFDE
jgi:hypothetical protein